MFKKLFESAKIGSVKIKNRIVMPAIHLGYAAEDGSVTQRIIDFYVERAKGGVGLIIIGGCYVDVLGRGLKNMLGLHEDKLISGYKKLVKTVKDYGAKVCAQLFHAGRYARSTIIGGQPVAPSSIPSRLTGETPKELTVEEILELEEKFADAAQRAKKAGFDMVEVLASTGYLVSEFLSPVTNKRNDEYGGSLENRMRFLIEIVKKIKEKLGFDYPILCRLSIDEFMEGGNTLKESKQIVQALERVGVDAINVNAGWHESTKPLIAMHVPRGAFVYLAEEIKKVIKIPVLASIRINNPVLAEKILVEEKADFICMGRPLIADPELPKKAFEGKLEDIRLCIACNQGCLDRIFMGLDVKCCINPAAGKESEYKIQPTKKSRRVLVVGGGPAGMEAARIAALRGHKVTLCEKSNKLGGQLNLASKIPGKEEIYNIIEYFENQLKKLGVKVLFNVNVDKEFVKNLKPDVVIIATGAFPASLQVEGVRTIPIVSFFDVLEEKVKVEDKIVVVGGGAGCEVAEFLSEKGKDVTLVSFSDKLAKDVGITTRWILLQKLKQKNIKTITGVKLEKICEKGVFLKKDDKKIFVEAKMVVNALSLKPNKKLFDDLKNQFEVYMVGDCIQPRKILEAIHEGFEVGRKI